MMRRPGLQHKAPVAIGTFDAGFIAHFQVDAGMAPRPAAALTGDTGGIGFDDFGSLDRHWAVPKTPKIVEGRRGSYKLRFEGQEPGLAHGDALENLHKNRRFRSDGT